MAKCPSPKNCPKQYLTKEVRYCTQCGIDVNLIDPPGGISGRKIIIALLAVLLLGAIAFWLIPRSDTPLPSSSVKIDEVLFTMSGSNTIGADLAPALFKAYLKKEYGISEIQMRQDSINERTYYWKNDAGKTVGIKINSHGSGTGFKNLKAKKADLAMSSRKIKDAEIQTLSDFGSMTSSSCEHVIGMDGLAILVHPDNPVNNLTLKQLAGLYSGSPDTWGDYWPGMNESIALYARDEKSGTWDFFESHVLNGGKLASKCERVEIAKTIVNNVSQKRNAIGFSSLQSTKNENVKILQLRASADAAIIPISDETIEKEDYILTRRLFFYTPESPKAEVKKFTDFVISEEGQKIVQQEGFVGATNEPVPFRRYEGVFYPDPYLNLVQQRLSMPFTIRFESASFTLDNKAKEDLTRAVAYFKRSGKRALLIGFADSVPSTGLCDNQCLSEQRAAAVSNLLTQNGVQCDKTTWGFSDAVPIGDNGTKEGQAKNRRVEIWVLD